MFPRKQILSAMAGVAMLSLPVSAFAGHHDRDWDDQRPFAWHDQGFHKGWVKHQIAPVVPPRFVRAYDRYQWTPAGWYGRPVPGPPLNYDPPAWQRHRWNYGFHRECEEGEGCEWESNGPPPVYRPYPAPNYRYNPGYWNEDEDEEDEDDDGGGRSYSWYQQLPPSGYSLAQRRDFLIARRQQAMVAIARLRARHDSRGAARLVKIVDALNQRIAGLNGGLGYNAGYRYAPPANYLAPANLLGNALPYNGSYYGNPYSGSYAGNRYSGASYYGNPTVDALSALVIPMLSGIH